MRFVSANVVTGRCQEIWRAGAMCGAALMFAASVSAVYDAPSLAAVCAALAACCGGACIGTLLVERRFR